MMSIDVIGCFKTEGGEQLFENASTMRLQVRREKKVMRHPLENGSSVIDHTVTTPAEGQLLLILPAPAYRDTYAVIKSSFLAGELFTLQTRADSFPNMFIVSMPHEETPEMMDALQVILQVQEAIFFKRQFQAITPRATRSTSTTRRGEQAPRSSVAYDLFAK